MNAIGGIKIFRMNDCDWWAAEDMESAIIAYLSESGFIRGDVPDVRELTDDEMDTLQFIPDDPDEDGIEIITFREMLERMTAPGGMGFFPCGFASTEY